MLKKIGDLLKYKTFISVATADIHGRPNAAPKFLLKIENNFIYLIDHSKTRTWENLKVNPYVSLSFMDLENLIGYQINGSVQIIDKGAEYEKIYNELLRKEVDLSTTRIIEGVEKEKKHKSYEAAIPDKCGIFKIQIEEIVEIGTTGELRIEKIKH